MLDTGLPLQTKPWLRLQGNGFSRKDSSTL